MADTLTELNEHSPAAEGAPQGESRRVEETWGASRAETKGDEKTLMAEDFCRHDFLVGENKSPEDVRETVASIIVNQGTSPNRVVEVVLKWIEKQDKSDSDSSRKSFFLTWYTPGHLVPTTLKEFRDRHRYLRTATKLFLLPGEVEEDTESVSGPDAEKFAEGIKRRFTYAFLSAYAFDVSTGDVYFYLPRELRLQKACATRNASHKFLFLDSSKFKIEGEKGYDIRDLLETADKVTVYTVTSGSPETDERIRASFKRLCASLLREPQNHGQAGPGDIKKLRLKIVGRGPIRSSGVEAEGSLKSKPRGSRRRAS